jgi:hypothetical protein
MSEQKEVVIKICPKCGRDSATTSFEKHSGYKKKSRTRLCDDCFREKSRERMARYFEDPEVNERAREYYRKRKASNPESIKNTAFKCSLKLKYGLTVEAYNSMVVAQENKCSICKRTPDEAKSKNKRLSIDHCHKTGLVRALLCQACNSSVGLLGDDPSRVLAVYEYLKKHGR